MAAKKSGSEMSVVLGLDVARYMGRWYEVASFPNFFQPRDGRDTRATYELMEDGATVHVLNETWSKGKRDYIEGTAYKADPASDEAKLKVKFYVPPFLPIIPVVGDYWVLYVDDDYQVALVGEPRRKSLWVSYIYHPINSSIEQRPCSSSTTLLVVCLTNLVVWHVDPVQEDAHRRRGLRAAPREGQGRRLRRLQAAQDAAERPAAGE
jgi:lipocalin